MTAVIEACNTQPYSHIHRPGVAVGGHCIPIYPQFYIFNDPAATIPIAARAANKAMPPYAVDLLEAAVGDLGGHDVVVLGAAYRGGVKETAFSGAHDLLPSWRPVGRPLVHDPLFSDDELRAIGFEPVARMLRRSVRSFRPSTRPIAILAHSTSESVWSSLTGATGWGFRQGPDGSPSDEVSALMLRARRLEAWGVSHDSHRGQRRSR